jgi:hypothetical protein
MIRGKSRILAYALLAFLAGFTAFGAQDKPKNLALSDSLALLKKPNITDVHQHLYGMPPPEMDMIGTNFGATRGTKNVTVDATPVTSYIHWGNTGITFTPPFPLVYWDHVYQFAIVNGSIVLSNVFSKRIPWDFDGMTPQEGPAGTEVLINVYRLPASPGGLVLKIGTFDFPIVSWTPPSGGGSFGKIKARVPPGVPLGPQRVYLQKGGEVASETYTFKVILPVIPPPKIIKKY